MKLLNRRNAIANPFLKYSKIPAEVPVKNIITKAQNM